MKTDRITPAKSETVKSRVSGGAGRETPGTVDFLLRRMRRNKDFPTFSKYLIEINQKLSSQEKYLSAQDLANVILKDYALTNKLLRLVNSAFYGVSAGKVMTVSRAVVLLGFEQVRLAAASLVLFEHLRSKTQKAELKDTNISSFISGLFAKKLAGKLGVDTEEAFICSMLHNLGNHLVIFYLPEEYKEINKRVAQGEEDEHSASRSVLGVSYDELGIAVARSWKFPEKIVNSMEHLPQGVLGKCKSEDDILRGISHFSNELSDVIRNTEGDAKEEAFFATTSRFKQIIPLSKKQLFTLVDGLKEDVEMYSDAMGIDLSNSDFIRRLTGSPGHLDQNPQIAGASPPPDSHDQKPQTDTTGPDLRPTDHRIHTNNDPSGKQSDTSSSVVEAERPSAILTSGIQEITNVLVEDYTLNDVLIMVLETMYRGFTFNRTLFCMMTTTRKAMNARFGLGKDIDELIDTFGFKLSKSPDCFNQAVSRGKDFRISDSNAPDMRDHIPKWYRKTVNAPAFIVYPILVNNVCLGLFYADQEEKGAPIPENQLDYMNILRNQILIAIKNGR